MTLYEASVVGSQPVMPDTDTNISSLLSLASVAVDSPGGASADVIGRVVDLLRDDPRVTDLERLRKAVQERELQMSTGVGGGFALPHARTDAVTATVAAFAVTKDPARFEAPDDVPVRLVFLLAGPRADMSRHIRILSRVSRLVQRRDLRSRLLAETSAEGVIAAFADAETELLAH